MKKFLFAIAILLGIGIISSCNKNNESANRIIGSWQVVNSESEEVHVGSVYTFEAGGTMLVNGFPYTQYRYDEQTRIIMWGGSGMIYVQLLTVTKMRWGGDPEKPDYYYAELERVNYLHP